MEAELLNILLKVKDRKINCEQALEDLAKIGYAPNLLNDDNNHWAVSFSAFQNLPFEDTPVDIALTCLVEKDCWKDSIYEALVWALEND